MIRFEAKIADVKNLKQIKTWVKEELRTTALKPDIKADAEKTVKGWQGDKPSFVVQVRETPKDYIYFTLFLRGTKLAKDKWNWLNEGTEEHPIAAVNAPRLAYLDTYKAGSKPGRLVSYRGKSSGRLRRPFEVWHPGNKARGWTVLLVDKHQKTFDKAFINALNNAIERSGHARKS